MKARCKICKEPATRRRGLAALCSNLDCEVQFKLLDKPKRAMKSKGPKSTPIRQSARGEDCTMMIPGVCNHNSETVVWAHSNHYEHGKGLGRKADDKYGCYACSSCHAVLDGQAPRPEGISKYDVNAYFDIAMTISRTILRDKGLLKDDE